MNSETRKTVYDALTAAYNIQKLRAVEWVDEIDKLRAHEQLKGSNQQIAIAEALKAAEAHEQAAADLKAQREHYTPLWWDEANKDVAKCPNGCKACDCH